MRLAGVAVRGEDVLTLAGLVWEAGFEDTADALIVAFDAEQTLIALTIQDREAILHALEDAPPRMAELRGVLVAEHERPVHGVSLRLCLGRVRHDPDRRQRRHGIFGEIGLGDPRLHENPVADNEVGHELLARDRDAEDGGGEAYE
jgi:hypothetical protein